jgi:hypothetical protein
MNLVRRLLAKVSPDGYLKMALNGIHFMEIVNAFQQTICLITAHKLGIFRLLSDGQYTAKQIANRLSLNTQNTSVILDALVSLKYLKKVDSTYRNTKLAEEQLLPDGRMYLGSILDMTFEQWTYWRELENTIRTGKGHPMLDVYGEQNSIYPHYIRSCCELLFIPSRLLLKRLDISGVKRMIAGTVGTTFIKAVKEKKSDIEVTVACLPHFIKELPSLFRSYGMNFEVEAVETDVDPEASRWGSKESYDLIFFARKFAYLEPEHGISYLKKALRVLTDNGLVVLWEPVQENFKLIPWFRTTLALQDAIMGFGQRIYTKKQIRGFLKESGFIRTRTVDVLGGTVSFTAGYKSRR